MAIIIFEDESKKIVTDFCRGELYMVMRVNNGVPIRAIKKFTDREEPRKVFWDTYDQYKRSMNDDSTIKVIMYYGMGGVGKTRLLAKIQEELEEKIINPCYVTLDFDKCSTMIEGLNNIQRVLRGKYRFMFPLYAMGLAKRAKLQQEGKQLDIDEIKINLGETADDLFDMLTLLEYIPFIDFGPKIVRSVIKVFNTAKKTWDRKKYKDWANGINEIKTVEEIDKYLPILLGHDIEINMVSSVEPLVIFIDTYEKLVDEFNSVGYSYAKDEWLKGNEGLICKTPKTIWVIAGRERLKWEEQNGDWKGSLEQHLMESVSELDAFDYFKSAGIPESLHHPLYEKTKGVPLFLDISVDTYYQIKELGEEPNIDKFGHNEQTIIERYIRYMDTFQQKMIYKMAFLGKWPQGDTNVFEYSDKSFDTIRFQALENSSCIKRFEEMCSLHEVVRDILREACPSWLKKELCTDIIGYYRETIPKLEDDDDEASYILPVAVDVAVRFYERVELGEFLEEIIWPKLDLLIDNMNGGMENICNLIYNDLVQGLGKDDLLTITALSFKYKSLYAIGRYQEAIKVAQIVFDMRLSILGEEHLETLRAMVFLAEACNAMGDYHSALELEIKVLEIRRKILGEEHLDTLWAMGDLANTYSRLGEYRRALKINKKVLDLRKRFLGEYHRDTIAAMGNLASLYSITGDFQRALQLEEKTLNLFVRYIGDKHPDTLWAMGNLANTYSRLGEYKRALELEEKVLEIRVEMFGEEHPDTLSAMGNLALTYIDLGDKKRKILSENNYISLADIDVAIDEYKKALGLEKKVLELREKISGEEHPDTLRAMVNLTNIYNELGNYQEALELGEKALNLSRNIIGEGHPVTVCAMMDLSDIYYHLGEFAKAKELEDECNRLCKTSQLVSEKEKNSKIIARGRFSFTTNRYQE